MVRGACMAGGVYGWGACIEGGVCGRRGMHGKGHMCGRRARMLPPSRYYKIWSMSGR